MVLSRWRAWIWGILGCSLVVPAVGQQRQIPPGVIMKMSPSATVTVDVDATEAPRKIFHSRMSIPATPGTLTVFYPEWIPGEHGPTGPIQDLTGLKFSAGGQKL